MLINASLGAARKMFNSQASGPRGPYSSVIFVTCPLNQSNTLLLEFKNLTAFVVSLSAWFDGILFSGMIFMCSGQWRQDDAATAASDKRLWVGGEGGWRGCSKLTMVIKSCFSRRLHVQLGCMQSASQVYQFSSCQTPRLTSLISISWQCMMYHCFGFGFQFCFILVCSFDVLVHSLFLSFKFTFHHTKATSSPPSQSHIVPFLMDCFRTECSHYHRHDRSCCVEVVRQDVFLVRALFPSVNEL